VIFFRKKIKKWQKFQKKPQKVSKNGQKCVLNDQKMRKNGVKNIKINKTLKNARSYHPLKFLFIKNTERKSSKSGQNCPKGLKNVKFFSKMPSKWSKNEIKNGKSNKTLKMAEAISH